MGIITAIKSWWSKMFTKAHIEQALGVKTTIAAERQREYDAWRRAYDGASEWNNDANPSLHIASGVCSEVARAVVLEFESELTGSKRADYLNGQYQRVVTDLRRTVEKCCADGVVIFRPFVRNGEIRVTVVGNDCFYPLRYNELDELTSVIFADTLERDEKYYTLLEKCAYEDGSYMIEYTAWRSEDKGSIGKRIPLTAAPGEWRGLPERVEWPEAERPWFSVFTMPGDGDALFARALKLIEQADKQFGRIIWEYEGSELAVDVSTDLMKKSKDGNYEMPRGCKRLFRTWDSIVDQGGFAMKEFAPEIRDISLFNGLNEFMRRIEFVCGLAYGTLSNPQDVAKTATEIKASKQRFYQTVSDVQKALESSLRLLIAVMDDIATRYKLAPKGMCDVSFFWDDSILVTEEEKQEAFEKEFARMLMLKQHYLISDATFMAFYNENTSYISKLTPEMIKAALENLPQVSVYEGAE